MTRIVRSFVFTFPQRLDRECTNVDTEHTYQETNRSVEDFVFVELLISEKIHVKSFNLSTAIRRNIQGNLRANDLERIIRVKTKQGYEP